MGLHGGTDVLAAKSFRTQIIKNVACRLEHRDLGRVLGRLGDGVAEVPCDQRGGCRFS